MSQLVIYEAGMALGTGYDTTTSDIHGVALEGLDHVSNVEVATGQSTFFRIELASSTLSLSKQLQVSATASLKYAVFGSGSIRTEFVESISQNTCSVFLVVRVTVKNADALLDLSQIELKQDAAQTYLNQEEFIQQYGDAFVYGITRGGEYTGILEIETSSTEEQQDIKAKISGSGGVGLWNGSASAGFQQALTRITTEYNCKITVLRIGGEPAAVLGDLSSDSLIQQALNFPIAVRDNLSVPYYSIVIPYAHIPHPPDATPFDIENRRYVLEELGDLRNSFIKFQNDLKYAISHQEQFPDIDLNKVEERYNLIGDELQRIKQRASSCFSNFNHCEIGEINFSLLEPILPARRPPQVTPPPPPPTPTIVVRSVTESELLQYRGNYPIGFDKFQGRMFALNRWARAQGYACGIPNMEQGQNDGGLVVFGAICISSGVDYLNPTKSSLASFAGNLSIDQIGETDYRIFTGSRYAKSQGYVGGIPSFEQSMQEHQEVWQVICIKQSIADRIVIPKSELHQFLEGTPFSIDTLEGRVLAISRRAATMGYKSAIPDLEQGDTPNGLIFGAVCFKQT